MAALALTLVLATFAHGFESPCEEGINAKTCPQQKSDDTAVMLQTQVHGAGAHSANDNQDETSGSQLIPTQVTRAALQECDEEDKEATCKCMENARRLMEAYIKLTKTKCFYDGPCVHASCQQAKDAMQDCVDNFSHCKAIVKTGICMSSVLCEGTRSAIIDCPGLVQEAANELPTDHEDLSDVEARINSTAKQALSARLLVEKTSNDFQDTLDTAAAGKCSNR